MRPPPVQPMPDAPIQIDTLHSSAHKSPGCQADAETERAWVDGTCAPEMHALGKVTGYVR